MNQETIPIKCSIVRGGTSKGIFILDSELPKDQVLRDSIILAIFGSPDVRQIDGLGGADVLTSKLAIIGPPSVSGADVDYTFGQVSMDAAFIDYKGNCGNISSAVGLFAIDAGIIEAREPVTTVRIHMTNSGKMLRAEVPVKNGRAVIDGDYKIDGVPSAGARIAIDWSDSIGAFTGRLLPTGNATDTIDTDEGEYEVSLVDAGNPLVFIEAASLGMVGTETPQEIESNAALMATIEKIRSRAAVIFGLVESPEKAAELSPYNPFFAIISKPASYDAPNGTSVDAGDVDVVSRLLFMLHTHKTYPITGTVCTAAAAMVPGSIVNRVMRQSAADAEVLRIGHPGGVIDVDKSCHTEGGEVVIDKIAVGRTARKIMEGTVFVQASRLAAGA
ncbi:MAG: 3-methylitaconate isomerase [Clostridiales Family XIII bacterium]|jgi:2-methylaconitate cis-trans-isomerase PrpF|nr:3-methylitaconate isomerase [Clostridiales Family XIII bacterium]